MSHTMSNTVSNTVTNTVTNAASHSMSNAVSHTMPIPIPIPKPRGLVARNTPDSAQHLPRLLSIKPLQKANAREANGGGPTHKTARKEYTPTVITTPTPVVSPPRPESARRPRRPGTPRRLMAIRHQWAMIIANNPVQCRRCHKPITANQQWDLGHPENYPYSAGNRDHGLAPEHRACNIRGTTTAPIDPTFQW